MIPKYLEKIMIDRYLSGEHTSSIGETYGLKSYNVYRVLVRNGVERRATRTLVFDDRYFDVIDTEHKAYWLGMLASDGFIGKDDKTFGIGLGGFQNPEDGLHLYSFLEELKSTHKIVADENMRSLHVSIRSPRVVQALKRYGFTSEKSKTFIPKMTLIPKDLHRHYWRGAVDGDGNLSREKGRYHSWTVGMCGTIHTCEAFRDFVKLYVNTNAEPHPISTIWYIAYGGRFIPRKVADLLYKDSNVALKRKMKSYLQLVAECPEKLPVRETLTCSKCSNVYVARGLCRVHYNEEWENKGKRWRQSRRPYRKWRRYLDS